MAPDQLPISRQEFHQYWKKAAWPLAPVIAAEFARKAGAPEDLLEVVQHLPNRLYMSESDFWEEFCTECREEGVTFHD